MELDLWLALLLYLPLQSEGGERELAVKRIAFVSHQFRWLFMNLNMKRRNKLKAKYRLPNGCPRAILFSFTEQDSAKGKDAFHDGGVSNLACAFSCDAHVEYYNCILAYFLNLVNELEQTLQHTSWPDENVALWYDRFPRHEI